MNTLVSFDQREVVMSLHTSPSAVLLGVTYHQAVPTTANDLTISEDHARSAQEWDVSDHSSLGILGMTDPHN